MANSLVPASRNNAISVLIPRPQRGGPCPLPWRRRSLPTRSRAATISLPPVPDEPDHHRDRQYHVLGHFRSASTGDAGQLNPGAASRTAIHRHHAAQPEHCSVAFAGAEVRPNNLRTRREAWRSTKRPSRTGSSRMPRACRRQQPHRRRYQQPTRKRYRQPTRKRCRHPTKCRRTRHPLGHPAPAPNESVDDAATSLFNEALARISLSMAARRLEPPSGPTSEPEQGTEFLSDSGLSALAGRRGPCRGRLPGLARPVRPHQAALLGRPGRFMRTVGRPGAIKDRQGQCH